MKCIFIIQYNDRKPSNPSNSADKSPVERFIQRIPRGKNFQLIGDLDGGVVWVVETDSSVKVNGVSESDFYMGMISELVAKHLNGFYKFKENYFRTDNNAEITNLNEITSATGFLANKNLAKWSRIPLNELIGCFVPIGTPVRGDDDNPYAILPLNLLSGDENLSLDAEGQLKDNNGAIAKRELLEKTDIEIVSSFISTFKDLNKKNLNKGVGFAGGEGGMH